MLYNTEKKAKKIIKIHQMSTKFNNKKNTRIKWEIVQS